MKHRAILSLLAFVAVTACGDDPVTPDEVEGARPDLVVTSIGTPAISCPGGAGTCINTVEVLVENIGDGSATAFNFRVTFDPAQSVVVSQPVPSGLPATLAKRFEVSTPQGPNCFDPNCTISVLVDDMNDVVESDETNNTASATTEG